MPSQPQPMMFDPQLRAKGAELQGAIKRLAEILLAHEAASGSRKRARKQADATKFYAAVEALACNLILLKGNPPVRAAVSKVSGDGVSVGTELRPKLD